jgi:hypothetical protein
LATLVHWSSSRKTAAPGNHLQWAALNARLTNSRPLFAKFSRVVGMWSDALSDQGVGIDGSCRTCRRLVAGLGNAYI